MPPKSILAEPISYEDAGKYLDNIKDNDLLKVYETHLGGTFKANKLKRFVNQQGFSGLMFWFCLEKDNLFLACEPKFNFEYIDNPSFSENLEPEQEKLIKPGKKPFGKKLKEVSDFEKFVREDMQTKHLRDKNILKKDVKAFKIEFEKNWKFKNHQKYGHAYFGNKEGYIDNFFKIDGIKNVRYYFGYDKIEKPNYIRVILAPVDSTGVNIQTKKLGDFGELLQRSVPPPPNN